MADFGIRSYDLAYAILDGRDGGLLQPSQYQTVFENQSQINAPGGAQVHELSIALSIIEGAQEEAERQGNAHVEAVHLRLGPLAGVVREALTFAYDLACEGTALHGSRLIIEEVPITFFCPECATERTPISVQSMSCPVCGTQAGQLLTGAELEIAALELQT